MQLNDTFFKCKLPTCKYTNICMQQTNFEIYLLIVEMFHVKQPMARLYNQEVEAQLWRELF